MCFARSVWVIRNSVRHLRIVFPGASERVISPAIFFNLVLSVIASFQVFTPAFIITQGGPNYASYFYVFHLYQYAFSFFKLGYASALAWLLFLIVLLFTLALFRWSFWVYHETSGEGR